MIRFLCKIPFIRKSVLDYAFKAKTKPKGFEDLHFAFRDSEGRKYYTFKDGFDVYMKRKVEIDTKLTELSAQLSKRELSDIVEAMKKAINRKQPDIATIGFLVNEIEKRNEMLVHEEIMFDLLALHYVREDENPAKVDSEIHDEKLAYFRQSERLDFFFENQMLKELFPMLEHFGTNLKTFMNDTAVDIQALRKWANQYTSAQESTNKGKT